MKRKVSIVLLTFIAVCCLCFGCTKMTVEDKRTVRGLETADTITVDFGDEVELEELNVYEEETNTYLEVYTLVTNSVGGYVDTMDGRFLATDIGGYTIEYLVCDTNNYNHTTQTSVIVNAPNAAEEISATYNSVVEINTPLKIQAVCGDENATLLYSVSLLDGENVVGAVDVDDEGNYLLTEKGKYLAEVRVQGNEKAYYSYEFVARAPMVEGEVEVYDDTWELVQEVTGDTRKMEVVTTAETDIKDRFGRDGSFAKITADPALNNVQVYVNPRGDESYYESLLEAGYTTVSLWVYMECENSHVAVIRRDPNGWNPYQSETSVLPVCHPNTWTEIPINLGRTESPLYKSFIEFIRYYERGMNIVEFSNDEYNIDKEGTYWGRDQKMTIYIDAVYAHKGEESINVSDSFEREYTVGDTVNLETFCSDGGEYYYSYVFKGKTTNIEGTTFTLTANGEYTIIAHPKTPNRAGKASLTIIASDEFENSFSYTYKAYERIGNSVDVPFRDFEASFVMVDGVTPTIERYAVLCNGAEMACTETGFTAEQDGMYEVFATASYNKNGKTCYTTVSFITDVYSETTRFEILDLDNMVAGVSDKQDKQSVYPTVEKQEGVTIGGTKGTYYYVNRNGYTATLYAQSRFSIKYYEQLIETYGECVLTFNLYADGHNNANGNDWLSYYGMFLGSTYYKVTEYQWIQKTMTLTEYLETYYERAKAWQQGAKEAYDGNSMYQYGQECKSEVSNWTSFILLYSYANTKSASDFYFNVSVAPQNAAIEISSDFVKEYSVGETVDLTKLCTEKIDGATYTYAYELNGGTLVEVQGEELLLTENGTYILHVYMQLMSSLFEATTEIVAVDSFQSQASYAYKAYERVADSVEIAFADLEVNLGEYNGAPLEISGYSVMFEGQTIALNGSGAGFTATADGIYTITARGVYTVENVEFATSVAFDIDVYSAATQYVLYDIDSMVLGVSDKQDNANEYPLMSVVENTEIGGKTGTYYFVDRQGVTATLFAKTKFSKAYYQNLIANEGDCTITFSIYTETNNNPSASGDWLSFYGTTLGGKLVKVYGGVWTTGTMSLSTYLSNYYDIAREYYNGAVEAKKTNTMPAYCSSLKAADENWMKKIFLHSYTDYKASDVYFNVSMALTSAQ